MAPVGGGSSSSCRRAGSLVVRAAESGPKKPPKQMLVRWVTHQQAARRVSCVSSLLRVASRRLMRLPSRECNGSHTPPHTTTRQVYVPPHPLVKHWLAVARNAASPTALFRSALAGAECQQTFLTGGGGGDSAGRAKLVAQHS
jgi:hypothetical protein